MTRTQPFQPDALVLVDVSPRWLYGHTVTDPVDGAFYAWTRALAQLTRRVHAVTEYLGEKHPTISVVTVEQEQLAWFRAPRQKMTLALAGLYGDACVKTAAAQLTRRGHPVVVVADLCVWEEPAGAAYPVPVLTADKLFPGIGAWIAQYWLDAPVNWDGQPLFTSDA